MNHLKLREECCRVNQRLPELGIVDLTFGNASIVDRQEGIFAIKPSGVPYTELTPGDIVLVSLETGAIVSEEGMTTLRPSSDTPTHRRLFQAFPAAGSVIHTHSRNATAFAQAGSPIPCFGTTHADYVFGEVPVTREMTPQEVDGDYEWETGNVIVERFIDLDPEAIPFVLVRSHAPFIWGSTGEKALENAFALEVIAEMAIKTLAINPQAQPVPPHLLQKHFLRKHGSKAYYGQV